MTKFQATCSCAAVLILASLTSWGFGQQGTLAHTRVDDIAWNELPDGRAVASVHGDMTSGEHLSFVRFPAGMKTVPHTHSTAYVGIVVKGNARHFDPESPETMVSLPAGSHYVVPGEVVHVSECLPGSECIFAIHQHQAFDRKVAE